MEICYRVTVDLGEVINSSASVSSTPTRGGARAIKVHTRHRHQVLFLLDTLPRPAPPGSVRLRSCEFTHTLATLKGLLGKDETEVLSGTGGQSTHCPPPRTPW